MARSGVYAGPLTAPAPYQAEPTPKTTGTAHPKAELDS